MASTSKEYELAVKIAGAVSSSFNSAMGTAENKMTNLGTIAKKAAAIAAAAWSALKIGQFISDAVDTYSEFEQAMANTSAIASATAEEYEALEAAALAMGKATTKTATECADALGYMSLAGWSVDESIASLEPILRLSEATQMDLATCSDLVTDSMSALGLQVSDLSMYLDICTAANNNANTTSQALMEAMIGCGGAAKTVGASLLDTSTAIGILANNGTKGSEAGTALNSVLARISSNDSAIKALDALGVSAFDASGEFVGLKEFLIQVQGALSNLSTEQQAYYLKQIAGTNYFTEMSYLLDSVADSADGTATAWDTLSDALENSDGALATMAETVTDTWEGAVARLESAVDDFKINLISNFAPYAKDVINGVAEYLPRITESMMVVAQSFLDYAIPKITQFKDKAIALFEKVKPTLQSIATAAMSAFNFLSTSVKTAVQRVSEVFSNHKGTMETLKQTASNVSEIIAAMWEKMKPVISWIAETAIPGIVDAVLTVVDKASALAETITENKTAVLALVGAFAAFKVATKLGGGLSGILSIFTGMKSSTSVASKGLTKVGNSMSSLSKSVLGVGAGLALAAAGIWLLVDAAKSITSAGPGAAVALVLMVGGIAALMAIASSLGKGLQKSKDGLIAFGAAILMAAAGMAIMSYAAVQISQAGPLAFAALTVMVGGIVALVAIAGTMGTVLAKAAPGLLAFGAAIILAAAGMAVMAYTAVQLSSAGGAAIATFAGLAVALAAFMVIAGLLGPMLLSGGAGMLLLGAGLLIAAAGMALLVNTAIQLSSAGAPAIITMAALAAGILVFGAAAGALAPLLLAGAAALAALGAALLVVSAAALVGSAALLLIAAALPTLSEYGATGALAIVELGGSMVVFAAGAAVAGAAALVAAAGFIALGTALMVTDVAMAALLVEMIAISAAATLTAAGLLLMATALPVISAAILVSTVAILAFTVELAAFAVAAAAAGAAALVAMAGFTALAAASVAAAVLFAAFSAEMVAVGAAVAIMAASGTVAAEALKEIKDAGTGLTIPMATLAAACAVAAAALTPLAVAAAATATAMLAFAASVTASDVALAAMLVEVLSIAAGLIAINVAMAAFQIQARVMSTSLITATVAFARFGTAVLPMAVALTTIVTPMTAAGTAATRLATGIAGTVSPISTISKALTTMTAALIANAAGFSTLASSATSGMSQTVVAVQTSYTSIVKTAKTNMTTMQKDMMTSLTAMKTSASSSFASIQSNIVTQMNRAKAAVTSAVSAMKSAMKFSWSLPYLKMPHIKITGAFNIDPPTAPKFSVSWYKEGGILDGAQIFGASGNTLLGGGEAGQEAVLPLSELWAQMREIMAEVLQNADTSSLNTLVEKMDAAMSGSGQTASLSELLDKLEGKKDDDDPDQDEPPPTYTITYSPTYQFYGDAPTQEDMTEAARMTQSEFDKMMDRWMRDNARKKF